MKRLTMLLVCATILMSACKSKKEIITQHQEITAEMQAADTTLPTWLIEKLDALNERHSEINLFEMDGQPYYAVFVKGPERSYDMNRTTIYDADGNVYLSLGGPRRPNTKETNFFEKATNKGTIWQSEIVIKKNEQHIE